MANDTEGGKYEVNGKLVNANGEPLKATKDAVTLETATEVVELGTDVVAGADKPKAGSKKG